MFTDKPLSNHCYILRNHKLRSLGQRGPQRNAEGFLSLCSEDSAKFIIQVSGCPALAAPLSRLSSSHIPAIPTKPDPPRGLCAWRKARGPPQGRISSSSNSAPDLETGRPPGLGTEEKAFLVSWPLSEEGEDAHFVYCKDMAPPHHTPTVSYSQLGCPRNCVDEGELYFCM